MVRPGTTITFPRVIREVVRERFFDDEAGKYDDQYSNSDEVWYQIISVGTVNLSGAVDLLWNTCTSACGYALPNSFSYIYSITCTDKRNETNLIPIKLSNDDLSQIIKYLIYSWVVGAGNFYSRNNYSDKFSGTQYSTIANISIYC